MYGTPGEGVAENGALEGAGGGGSGEGVSWEPRSAKVNGGLEERSGAEPTEVAEGGGGKVGSVRGGGDGVVENPDEGVTGGAPPGLGANPARERDTLEPPATGGAPPGLGFADPTT